jgi:hypothetical protein
VSIERKWPRVGDGALLLQLAGKMTSAKLTGLQQPPARRHLQ